MNKKQNCNLNLSNIESTTWMKSLDFYPKTSPQLDLLKSLLDKMDLFAKYDITNINVTNFSAIKLDVMYLILRIDDYVFKQYSNRVINDIFKKSLHDVFPCTNLMAHDMFFDQLTQDLDVFVLENYIDAIDVNQIRIKRISKKFISCLKNLLDKPFYKKIVKKLNYNIDDDDFLVKHQRLFEITITEYILFTRANIIEIRNSLQLFLTVVFESDNDNIFDNNQLHHIHDSLIDHIDIQTLLDSSCMEIQIYSENIADGIYEDKYKNSNSLIKNQHIVSDTI